MKRRDGWFLRRCERAEHVTPIRGDRQVDVHEIGSCGQDSPCLFAQAREIQLAAHGLGRNQWDLELGRSRSYPIRNLRSCDDAAREALGKMPEQMDDVCLGASVFVAVDDEGDSRSAPC